MSEFKKVANAQMSPTHCALCGAHEGPFIDTHWDTPVHGHVYICASTARRAGCVRQMARLDGMVEEQALADAKVREVDLTKTIEHLKAELAESQVVPMTQVIEFVEGKLKARKVPSTSGTGKAKVTITSDEA